MYRLASVFVQFMCSNRVKSVRRLSVIGGHLHFGRRLCPWPTAGQKVSPSETFLPVSGRGRWRNRMADDTPARRSSASSQDNSPTVGIIIIGDEILKGHVHDTNSHFLCKRLFSLGVKVKRISVIPDELDIIAREVAEFSRTYTHVITAGGIGPTHDDVTFEGVAKAFNEQVHPHPDLVALCKRFFGTDDLKSPKLKLAHVPQSAELLYGVDKVTGKRNPYPLVNIRNVFVFPGVPGLMERAFNMLEDMFRNPNAEFFVKVIYIKQDEASIAGALNEVDEQFRDKVILGSYPDFYNSYYKVKLTLESEVKEHVEQASQLIHSKLGEWVVNYDKDPVGHAVENVYRLISPTNTSPASGLHMSHTSSTSLTSSVQHTVSVIEECLDKYSLKEICVGFNGGKDCTALLHMVHAVIRKKCSDQLNNLQALYIRRGQPFPEIELFLKKTKDSYNLELINIHGRIKDALFELKKSHPHIRAVIMGTRRTDPHSAHLQAFSPTDPGWAEYMRVCPMLDWSYADVWAFLRHLNLPYCSLYDRGYTSLGSMENTHPNPSLQRVDSKGIISYRPAYELQDRQSERAGRN